MKALNETSLLLSDNYAETMRQPTPRTGVATLFGSCHLLHSPLQSRGRTIRTTSSTNTTNTNHESQTNIKLLEKKMYYGRGKARIHFRLSVISILREKIQIKLHMCYIYISIYQCVRIYTYTRTIHIYVSRMFNGGRKCAIRTLTCVSIHTRRKH